MPARSDVRIDVFYGVSSPWAYLGAPRLDAIAARHGATITLRPVRIIEANGGIPLRKRPDARQRYHEVELDRWRRHLGMTLNLKPRFYPCRTIEPAAKAVIAVEEAGRDARRFSFAVQRALWAEERDIADPATLREIARASIGEAGIAAIEDAPTAHLDEAFARNLAEAESIGIFGTPTYVVGGELFWGQDRLDFLERAIAREAQPITGIQTNEREDRS